MLDLQKIAEEAFKDELKKLAGKNNPGVRDMTGPYKGSKGRRKMAGQKCPNK